MYDKEKVLEYLKEHYPNRDTEEISLKLGLTKSTIWTLARRNGIYKSKEYLNKLHTQLMKVKEEKYLQSIPKISLNQLEQNIIVGSILGDGSLTFSNRSRNAYYREHFSIKQIEYRKWKIDNIHSLKFRIQGGEHLKSPSHPIFTELYNSFYKNGIKTITTENIKLLNHPIGLACLYLDDGTLIISTSKINKNIRINSIITISTLSFSKKECEILVDHLLKEFGINFYINAHPDGKGWIIKISKIEQIENFINLIMPYCLNIPCLKYKWDLHSRIEHKNQELMHLYNGKYNIKVSSVHNIPNYYSAEDEEIICNMKRVGKTYNEIAAAIGRSYNAVSYKIHQLKQQNKI